MIRREGLARKDTKVTSAIHSAPCTLLHWACMYRGFQQRRRVGLAGLGIILLTVVSPRAEAQGASPSPAAMPPGELVRLAVANEAAAADTSTVNHMFLSRRQTPKGSQTRLYVETDDAIAAMLIADNDRPLTPQQEQGESNHLKWLMANPDQLRKKHAREKEDADRTLRIVKALPDAFRYRYASAENSAGPQLVRVDFVPNPSYSPPTHVEQVLTGMRGYLLIDTVARRLARIDGTLFKDVSFGWGIFGRLDKGGHFLVTQADLGDGSWDITEMKLDISGRILLFKSLSMVSDEVFSDFRRVPDRLTFAQGVEMLKTEQAKRAHPPAPSQAKKTP